MRGGEKGGEKRGEEKRGKGRGRGKGSVMVRRRGEKKKREKKISKEERRGDLCYVVGLVILRRWYILIFLYKLISWRFKKV